MQPVLEAPAQINGSELSVNVALPPGIYRVLVSIEGPRSYGVSRLFRLSVGDWRVLKVGSITAAASAWPQNAEYLLQTEAEFKAWTQQYGLTVPADGVDFALHTVAVLIRPYGALEPRIKAVNFTGMTARVVLADNPARPNPIPGLPAGFEVRQYLVLQLPKVDALSVVTE